MPWHISNWLFSSLPTKNWRDFFLIITMRAWKSSYRWTQTSVRAPLCLGFTGVVNCRVWPFWASSNCQLQFRFPTLILIPLVVSMWGFLLSVQFSSVQFSSVAQSCLTLCDPMNHSTPGLPVHHQLPEFTQIHVHRFTDAIQPSHPLLSPSPPAPNPSQHQCLFQWVNSSHEVAKVLEFQL